MVLRKIHTTQLYQENILVINLHTNELEFIELLWSKVYLKLVEKITPIEGYGS